MRRSDERVLTTHVGSLPRPLGLAPEDVEAAVADAVRRQREVGIDVVSDGEMSKPGFVNYVADRLTGFGGESPFPPMGDLAEFPEYAAELFQRRGARISYPRCEGPVGSRGTEAARADVERLKRHLDGAVEAFVPAASPGVIVQDFENAYYPSREEYLEAVAEAMRPEYEAIVEGGLLLQVDAPDLAMGRHLHFADLPLEPFRAELRRNAEAINDALRNIPSDRVRLHVCWGNYPGPHHRDVPLREIVDVVLSVRADGLSVEGANPRHNHEWRLWEDVPLPEGKVLIPGVIDTLTNHVEHPELVCERIVRLAQLVGRENVIASTDCGFGTFAGVGAVHPSIAWAKLAALAEGAALASEELWG